MKGFRQSHRRPAHGTAVDGDVVQAYYGTRHVVRVAVAVNDMRKQARQTRRELQCIGFAKHLYVKCPKLVLT